MPAEEEDENKNNLIKMEIDIDEENIVVYNIIEETESISEDYDDPLLSLAPVVYTTKLDDMNIVKRDLTKLNGKEILNKLNMESKPILLTKINKSSSNSENIESFLKLTSVIDTINFKAEDEDEPELSVDADVSSSSDVDVEGEVPNYVEIATEIDIGVDIKEEFEMPIDDVTVASVVSDVKIENKKELMPCYVVLQDIKKKLNGNHTVKLGLHNEIISQRQMEEKPKEVQSRNPENNTVSSGRTRRKRKSYLYSDDECASSDNEYVPDVKDKKKFKGFSATHTIHRPDETSQTNKLIVNNIANKKSVVTNKKSMVTNKTSGVSNKKSVVTNKNSMVTDKNSGVTNKNSVVTNKNSLVTNKNSVGPNDFSSPFIEKYGLIVLIHKKNRAFIYRVNLTRIVTDFYFSNIFDEYKIACMYPKDEKIIEEYCCWYNREEIINKICSKKNYPHTILKFLKVAHSCHPEECCCCCRKAKSNKNQNNDRHDVIYKAITEADNGVRELLNKTTPTSDRLLCKALTYDAPKAIKENFAQKKVGKYMGNYLLCIKNKKKLNIDNELYELYEIEQNGDIVTSFSLFDKDKVMETRKNYQAMSMLIRDAELCCWFKRETLLDELKMIKTSPTTLKCLRKHHSCQKCTCCCKPSLATPSIVKALPSDLKQTSGYEIVPRSLKIQFSAKSRIVKTYEKIKKTTIPLDASKAAILLSDCARKNNNPDLSMKILKEFKNLTLGVDSVGELEIVLNESAKKLSVAELKVLSEILVLSTKQIDKLGLSPEEFCNRINSKSDHNIIFDTNSLTVLKTAQEIAPLPFGDDDFRNNYDDPDPILPKQTIAMENTFKTVTSDIIKAFKPTEQTNITTPSKTNICKPVSSLFTSLSHLMETKNKSYVSSFKSFFDKSTPSRIGLPNMKKFTPVPRDIMNSEITNIFEVETPMPVIKETFSLNESVTEEMPLPGPSGVKVYSSAHASSTCKKEIISNIDDKIQNKIRVKLPSELNATSSILKPHLFSDGSQINSTSTWTVPVVVNNDQTNLKKMAIPVDSTSKVANSNKRSYGFKIVNPISVKKIVLGSKNLQWSVQPNRTQDEVRYLTITPSKTPDIVDKGPRTPQITNVTTHATNLPPLVPLSRHVVGTLAPKEASSAVSGNSKKK